MLNTNRDLLSNEVVTSVISLHLQVCSLAVVSAICGVSTPVLAKHSTSFSLIRLHFGWRSNWNSELMPKQVEAWQKSELTDLLLRNRSNLF